MKTTFAALGLVLALPGCAALSALQGEPARDVFELRAPVDTPRQCGQGRRGEVVVEVPKAGGVLDTDRIMIRPNALQVQYLPDARWSDSAPVMLQTLLVRSLGAYDVFTHVGREPLGLSGDYAMLTEISDFNAVTGEDGTRIVMRVNAQIVNEMDARIIARRQFAVSAPAAGTATAQLIPAFDAAALSLVGQMNAWAIGAVGGNAANCR
ncbi:ABC-type transport auxiliary lipoprotein family protein [Paracoccus sp. (in: a-proteobacteria)]|uniref:ABC-type transport auxiliary lipoprotein family protein n=1 Tax=Paracoccus sp. TaxID=267 RepID=UPI0026E08877|nr:ABC-type transport auxiliary lipoprotein family protein [Paracoccus sp. (in: a-proteobacteria)]MDO5646824.1 ABC-type transport auxiliary lipoprotein family protein [Paracoccus sp. (in: a-proteobacteria)]